jgi:hypothetical protein
VSGVGEVIHQGLSEVSRGMQNCEGGKAHVKLHMVKCVIQDEYSEYIDYM